MNFRRMLPCFAVILLAVLLSACAGSAAETTVPDFPPLPGKAGLRVAVASDLHLNPDDRPHGDEPLQSSYNLELADALLWDARRQGADLLLLTGDLCNGGKQYRHEALTEKLRAARDGGLTVLVLPGNHDLAPIGQAEFAELYADFGYTDAFSRDDASLSYCYICDDLMLLMMDTAGYSIGAVDLPGAARPTTENPFFTEKTLQWAEQMLRVASERGLRVLAAGHYNLLPAISRDPDSNGYFLENGDRFAALLRAYGVPLYLSGHMHIRAVYQEDVLTELLTEYLLSYPTAYSVLDLTDGKLVYTPRRIDVDAWAAASGQSDPNLLHFAQWQQDALRRYAVTNVDYMSARNPLSRREKAQAADFFYRTMDAYWRGELYEQRDALETLPGCDPFFRCAEGYAYGWWLRELMDTANPLVKGFELEYPIQLPHGQAN